MPRRRIEEVSSEPEVVDVSELVPELIKRVKDPLDIRSWRKAFPGIDFSEVDEGFTGDPIDWDGRTPAEKAIYVAYMAHPHRAEVEYRIEIDGYEVRHQIDDSERIWYLWMRGCLVSPDGKAELSDEAKTLLLYYAAQGAGDFEEMVMERYGADDVKLVNLEMTVAKI